MKSTIQNYIKIFLLFFIFFICLINCEKDNNNPENSGLTKFTVTPEGGEYNFENGIKLKVPAGAVSEETEIEIKYTEITDDSVVSIFTKRGITSDDCFAIIEAKPDGITFNSPVTVTIPAELVSGDFPSVYEYDLANGTYAPAITDISYNPDEGTIEFSLSQPQMFSSKP